MPGVRGEGGVVSLSLCSGEVGMVIEGKSEGEQLFLVFVAACDVIWLVVAAPSLRGREEERAAAGMRGGGGPRGPREDTSWAIMS